ncbi:MAG: prepilin peptidase [Candidatus Sumerlaeia bacterium]|nr:prepilin peptidase [Candidatus Sumerlaeia bacterium]
MNTQLPPDPTVVDILTSPDFFWLLAVMAFVLGASIGSFLNVCILRLPLGMSVNHPKRSFCFRCGAQIAWYDNLPIISYFILGGRDRHCGSSYSPRYMLIELFTGLGFLGLFLSWNAPGLGASGFSLMTIWYIIFFSILMIAIFTDFDHWIHIVEHSRYGTLVAFGFAVLAGFFDQTSLIALSGPFPYIRLEYYDWVEVVVSVLAGPAQPLPKDVVLYWWEPLANSVIGAFFGPGLIFLIGYLWKMLRGQEGMGFGDVELFVLIGATFGAVNSVLVLVVASFVGSIVGIFGILRQSLKPREVSPLDLGRWQGTEESPHASLKESDSPVAEAEIDPEEIERARKFAVSLGLEFEDLAQFPTDPTLIDEFPAALAMEELVLPLSRDGKGYTLAVANPQSSQLITRCKELLANGGGEEQELRFRIAPESVLLQRAEEVFGERYRAEQQESEHRTEAEELRTHARRARWQGYALLTRTLPLQKASPSLPFIPWIAVGCLLMLFAYPLVLQFLDTLLLAPLDLESLNFPETIRPVSEIPVNGGKP